MDKILIEVFEGPNGKAEVYEVTNTNPGGIEQVEYEILFASVRQVAPSMGLASVMASELSGDPRFLRPDQMRPQ